MTQFETDGKAMNFRLKSILLVLTVLAASLTVVFTLNNGSEDVSAEETATVSDSSSVITGSCGPNAKYTFDPDTGKMTISGSGRMDDCEFLIRPWLGLMDKISEVVIEDGITYIGAKSFETCYSITKVTIGNSVTEIGTMAFDSTQISTLVLPDSVKKVGEYAFARCKSLTDITFSCQLQSIGKFAFGYCEALKSVTIPASVTYIGPEAFYHCNNLISAEVSPNVKSIESKVFAECYLLENVTLGKSISYIGDNAFFCCKSLKTIDLTGVSKIYSGAFYLCAGLESVVLSSSLTEIQGSAFGNCSALKEISIPDKLSHLGPCAFKGCSSLESVNIPSTITEIGEGMFQECSKLKSIVIPDSVTAIYKFAFCGCSSLTEATIGKSVKTMEYGIFDDCSALTTLRFNAVDCTVYEYGSLFSKAGMSGAGIDVIFGNEVVKIPANLFYEPKQSNSSKIVSLAIPNSVTSIGNRAFANCVFLTEIYFNAGSCADLSADAEVFMCAGISGDGITVTFGNIVKRVPLNLFFTEDPANAPNVISVDFETVTSIGNNAFCNCTSLRSIKLPDTLESIGDKAFFNCSSLTSLTVPENVNYIGSNAFAGCTALNEIRFNAKACSNMSYGWNAFLKAGTAGQGITVIFGDAVTRVPASIFFTAAASDSPNVVSVTFGKSITAIGDRAFYNCTHLQNFVLPDTLESIGYGAFGNCSSITTITIPESVITIGNYAFSGCTAVNELNFNAVNCIDFSYDSNVFYKTGISGGGINVTFSDKITKIPDYMFYVKSASMTPALANVNLGSSVTTIGNCAFGNCTFLSSIAIPDSVTTIEDYAFYNCTGLTDIGFGKNLDKIGYAAFSNCSLTSVTIPDYVKTIGAYAFSNCTHLISLTIGKWVMTIGNYAFMNCTALEKLVFTASVCSDLTSGSNLFYNCGTEGNGISISFDKAIMRIPDYLFYVSYSKCSPSIVSVDIPTNIGLICANSFGSLVFYDSDGNKLDISAAVLAGHRFTGSDGVLFIKTKMFLNAGNRTVSGSEVSDALAELGKTANGDDSVLVLDSDKNELTVSSSALESLANSDSSAEFKLKSGIFEFSDDATETLASAGTDITLSITDADTSVLDKDQKTRIGDASVYSLTAASGTSTISAFNGNVTVILPYKLSAGKTAADVEVYHLHEDGELEKVDCTYDPSAETVTFQTNHFSVWAVTDDGLQTVQDNTSLIAIVIVEIVSVICIALCVRKHFKAN